MPSILITGANRGLGLEFAKQYAEAGYRVFATAREPQKAQELRALANAQSALSVHALDTSEPESVAALARDLAGQPLDILLNNAGVMGPKQQSLGHIDYAGLAEAVMPENFAREALATALQRVLANPSDAVRARAFRHEIEAMPPMEDAIAKLEAFAR